MRYVIRDISRCSCHAESAAGRRASGFTLIEVLISLTLLTIVLGAVYSSFSSVQNVYERFSGVSMKYHEARTALDIMRREVEASFYEPPPRGSEKAENDRRRGTVFEVRDRDILGKSVSELRLTAFTFRDNAVHTVAYYIEEKEDRLDLMKKEMPSLVRPDEYTMDIIEGVEGFSVDLLYGDKWVRTWNAADTGRLPEILRLSIEFDDNGKKVRLTEYARTRIGKRP